MTEEEKKEEKPAAGGSKKLLIILAVTNVLSLGGIGYFVATGSSADSAEASDEAPAEKIFPEELGPTVDVGTFTINLADPGQTRYLKAIIKASVNSDDTVREIEDRDPQVRDVVISYLSSLTIKETQGARMKTDIRDNLKKRLNNILRTGEVTKVYLTEFVTQ